MKTISLLVLMSCTITIGYGSEKRIPASSSEQDRIIEDERLLQSLTVGTRLTVQEPIEMQTRNGVKTISLFIPIENGPVQTCELRAPLTELKAHGKLHYLTLLQDEGKPIDVGTYTLVKDLSTKNTIQLLYKSLSFKPPKARYYIMIFCFSSPSTGSAKVKDFRTEFKETRPCCMNLRSA